MSEPERKQLQDLLREVLLLNTDLAETLTALEKRGKELRERIAELYCKVDNKLNGNNEKENPNEHY